MTASGQFPRVGVNLSAGTSIIKSGIAVLSQSNGIAFGMQTSNGLYVVTASAGISAAIQSISAGTTKITSGTASLSPAGGLSFGLTNSVMTVSPLRVSYWNNSRNGRDLEPAAQAQGILFQRCEFRAPIVATRLELITGNATSNAHYVSGAFSYNVTPGQYLVAFAISTGGCTVAFYTMAGSTAGQVASGSIFAGALFGVPLLESAMLVPGGGSYANYFADGTYVPLVVPPLTVHLTDIQRTTQFLATAALPLVPNLGYNVPFFQLFGP